MQLIILDCKTLTVKDYAFVSDEFEIIIDLVVPQKSSFIVNKNIINGVVGDLVTLKHLNYFYLGVIDTIESIDDYKIKILTKNFTEIFNIKVPVNSYSGDLILYIENLIIDHFKNNEDNNQNLNYLRVNKKTTATGTINFDKDTLMSITEVIEMILKMYILSINIELVIEDGSFKYVDVVISKPADKKVIKSNMSAITDLIIISNDSRTVNKITFYPKNDNLNYKNSVSFYLLRNNEVSTNKDNPLRFSNVIQKSELYSDNDYINLTQKAKKEFLNSSLNHSISFNVYSRNNLITPIVNLKTGDYIDFIKDERVYETQVTQMKFANNFYQATVTLGEYRVNLTDKLKLLNKE